MFSGIVETIGSIIKLDTLDGCKQITIARPTHFKDILIGDSIAINGVCLTVTTLTDDTFEVALVPETLRQTNLGYLRVNDTVNLERSLTLLQRIGGHYVQGHVDDIGEILEIASDSQHASLITISVPKQLAKYVVTKGYIALDGMSMTIVHAASTWFTVTLIPHTQSTTIAHRYQVGSLVNLEVDIIGKYVEKLVGAHTHVNLH